MSDERGDTVSEGRLVVIAAIVLAALACLLAYCTPALPREPTALAEDR